MKRIFLLLIFITTPLICEVAKEFQYTGVLYEFGQPVNGVRKMIFSIYDQPNGGLVLWSSGEVNVNISSGVFSYTIPLYDVDLRDKELYLQMIVEGKIFSPRQKIMPQVFALHSNTAEGLTKKGDIHFVIDNTTYAVLSPQKLLINGDLKFTGKLEAVNAIDTQAIIDNAITSQKIKDGTITDVDIADDAGISLTKTSGGLPPNRIGPGELPFYVIATSVAVNAVHTQAIQNDAITSEKIKDLTITNADISSTAEISWYKISKTGSSLSDLTYRNAGDLNMGNLSVARMPTGGNWDITSDLSIKTTYFVVKTNGLIGIGTASPLYPLDIQGTSSYLLRLKNISQYPTTSILLEGNYISGILQVLDNPGGVRMKIGTSTNHPVDIVTGMSPRMTITSDGKVGINTQAPTDTLTVNGSFSATSKNFIIDHPTKPGKKLVHACLEGPENAVFYRGEGKLVNGVAEIVLPEYFENLTRKDKRTILLTPISEEPFLLSCTRIQNGKFKVYGSKSDGEFFWEVKAIRADIEELQVEK